MGGTVTALSTTLVGYRDSDYPVLICSNEIADYNDIRANVTGVFTDADGSDSDYPARNLADLSRADQWRYGSSQTTVYILVDMGAGSTADVDCMVYEGHDEKLDGGTIRVRCSDTLTGGNALDNPDTLFTVTMSTGRYVKFADSQYNARYWEIQIDTGATSNSKRAIQLWLGKQIALPHRSRVPYDEGQKVSEFSEIKARSGRRRRVMHHHNIARRDLLIWINDTATISLMRTGYTDALGWADPIWYIENPSTDPHDSALFGYVEEPGLDLPSQLSIDKEWAAAVEESGPHID